MRKWIFATGLGASLAYFFDPDRGARRRNIARDKFGSWMRKLGLRSARISKHAAGHVEGVVMETVPHRRDNPNPDDVTLKDRVESELFRDAKVPKGQLNVNVAQGAVELRGQLESQQMIDDIVARVQGIPDVKSIHNYLHTPGTPAPNKEEAIRAS